MNRIRNLIATRGERKLLVPFFTVGYPDVACSTRLALAAANSGADMIELGMPFSDPLADGPAIQYSSQIALRNGTNLDTVIVCVSAIRTQTEVPLVLMGYYNPIFAYGTSKFLKLCARTGVDGLIIPDLPIEEATEFCTHMKSNDLSSIFLVAPTSSTERVKAIDRHSSDFVYAVTVTGVTGARRKFDRSTEQYLSSLRRLLTRPFVAGFGVSSAESAKRLARYSDGVVIGSELISQMREARTSSEGVKKVTSLLSSIRRALDRV